MKYAIGFFLAWRITVGSYEGVALDGLRVSAAVDADRSAVVAVDPRATPAQRAALADLVLEMSNGLISEVTRVETAPVRFGTSSRYVDVEIPDSIQFTR